jgi:hypothetical protein
LPNDVSEGYEIGGGRKELEMVEKRGKDKCEVA